MEGILFAIFQHRPALLGKYYDQAKAKTTIVNHMSSVRNCKLTLISSVFLGVLTQNKDFQLLLLWGIRQYGIRQYGIRQYGIRQYQSFWCYNTCKTSAQMIYRKFQPLCLMHCYLEFLQIRSQLSIQMNQKMTYVFKTHNIANSSTW